ncbi:sporulation protein [Deinococcus maricopensis]|uniref:SpoOM family protein n=1 Tax=Deinococcus maricopensis (strain DSM 21211 / LMG 22137 / NRRL B-23946 / LB-34) TaxID=709986 RepID=E8U7T1_DEIML|nr:sporulation protein [Deinococcus maricopensis]ADV67120.1 SpoOM family protein [Deinococcus maricopensis DSM 21211]
MSFFKRMLASVGVGGARVDARLERDAVRLGEDLRGVVLLSGGAVEQNIERLNFSLMTLARHDDTTSAHAVARVTLGERVTLRAGETRELPFHLTVPYHAPISAPGVRLWLHTDADIAGASDPGDEDSVRILPNAPTQAFLDALSALGFHLKSGTVEFTHGRLVQELEFAPPHGQGHITELEVVLLPGAQHLDVRLEVDRRARGLHSLFTSELEARGLLRLTPELLAGGAPAVQNEVRRHIQRLS